MEVQANFNAPLKMGFNIRLMLDVINAASGESVVLHFASGDKSVLVTDSGNPDARHVVMPMRL